MFADTITMTDVHGTDDFTLVRINQDKYSSEYRYLTDLASVSFKIRNTTRKDKSSGKTFDRHNVELVETVFPVSPSTVSVERKAYLTFEVQQGDVLAKNAELVKALCAWLTASSGANISKLEAFES